MSKILNASLREDAETFHHITSSTGILGILDTAGLLAEAINFRQGYTFQRGNGPALQLSVIYDGPNGAEVTEYTIRCKGAFWLANAPEKCEECGEADISKGTHGLGTCVSF